MEHISSFFSSLYNNMQLFKFSDLLDILVVAFLIYKGVELIRKNHAFRLAKGLGVLLAVLALSEVLHLTMIRYFITKGLELGLLAVVILFQPELRRLLEKIGSGRVGSMFSSAPRDLGLDGAITQTVLAYNSMSHSKTGALMVFERSTNLSEYTNTGTIINAEITSELIRNIFFEPAPLHDGAVIIRDGKLAAAGCMLPLSNNNTLSHDLGMRHRAAIGISEHSDAVVAVVSEETGAISVAINGMIKRHLDIETFESILRAELVDEPSDTNRTVDKLTQLLNFFKGKKHEESDS